MAYILEAALDVVCRGIVIRRPRLLYTMLQENVWAMNDGSHVENGVLYFRPGLNWRPSECKSDVITTTPRKRPNSDEVCQWARGIRVVRLHRIAGLLAGGASYGFCRMSLHFHTCNRMDCRQPTHGTKGSQGRTLKCNVPHIDCVAQKRVAAVRSATQLDQSLQQ